MMGKCESVRVDFGRKYQWKYETQDIFFWEKKRKQKEFVAGAKKFFDGPISLRSKRHQSKKSAVKGPPFLLHWNESVDLQVQVLLHPHCTKVPKKKRGLGWVAITTLQPLPLLFLPVAVYRTNIVRVRRRKH